MRGRVTQLLPRACRGDDPDGTVLNVGATEAIIGTPGTVGIDYYDDTQAGTFNFLNYTTTVVSATTGISYAWGATPPLAGMGDAPWALRWNQWVSVTQAGLYTVTVSLLPQTDPGLLP